MEKNKKLTEVPLAQTFTDGSVLAVIGGSLKRVPKSLLPSQSGSETGTEEVPFVTASAPTSGYSYIVNDDRITLEEGNHFYCIFADDSAPSKDSVTLNVNGIECVLYWKGENISMMSKTLGEVFTNSNGYIHFIYRNGHLELIGVDTISSGTRIYSSPSIYIENGYWYEA